MLALALDQAIFLFPSSEPIAGEEHPRYLRTVQYHPILGWSGYPNLIDSNDGIDIRTNSLAYRDREPVQADDQKLRVLFAGDSFTWGDEVRVEDRFTNVVEAYCERQCGGLPPIRAINKGIIGYGTDQAFLQYLVTREEQRFDMVVLSLFTGNDLTDNAVVDSPSGPRPRLIRCDRDGRDQQLCLEGVPIPPVLDWPEHRWVNPRGRLARTFDWSGLITLASSRRAPRFLIEARIAREMEKASHALPFPMIERTSDSPIADRVGQLEAILGAFDRSVRAGGQAFGVLLFPSALVYAGELDDELREYHEVLNVLRRLNIPFADYYETTKGSQLNDLYFGRQGHWRPKGHEEAAKLVLPLLSSLQRRRH
jgi:lysophospholipase L1-like esterase